jgi:hypothetical protein
MRKGVGGKQKTEFRSENFGVRGIAHIVRLKVWLEKKLSKSSGKSPQF